MTDTERDGDSPAGAVGSLTRRTLLKVAGLVSLFSDAAVGSAGAADAAPASASVDVAAATRTATVDERLGRYARAVALDGATALVGAPPTSEAAGPSVGRAAVLSRSGGAWARRATLVPDGDDGQFGRAVALDGDTAVVGGELGPDPTGDHAGSAAVFARDGGVWTRRATLGDAGAEGVDLFGTAVDVADDTLVVGASSATTDGGRRSGAAFVYARSGDAWRRRATLAPDAAGVEAFGRAVALDGDTAVVGARRTDGSGVPTDGTAFVFERRGGRWRELAELEPGGRRRDDGFGTALATDGETVVGGAPTETNATGANAGAAHVFTRRGRGWRRRATLRDDDGAANGRFGATLALDGNVALVDAASGGAPAVFARSGGAWSQATTLDAGRGTDTVVALDGARALVAADGDGERSVRSVEVFEP